MRLDRFLAKSRIIDVQSRHLEAALEELLLVATSRSSQALDRKQLLADLMDRENLMTTSLGNGVALPHLRTPMKRPFLFALGRCPHGIEYDGSTDYQKVRLLFLLLASDEEKNYLNVLASLARILRQKDLVNLMVNASSLDEFQKHVFRSFSGVLAKPAQSESRFNRMLLREAEKIAKASRCSAILIFADTFSGSIDFTETIPNFRTILVTRASTNQRMSASRLVDTIQVRTLSRQRLSQLRSAVLIGLTRGLFRSEDRLCCVGGIPHSNQLDALVVVDVEREFQSVLTRETDLLPKSVKAEVVERLLAVATELAVEGREGRPVGCLFVLGDTEKVNTMVKPLLLNPFHGYPAEDRNILNPFMDETVKELSSIDGAFVVNGDGVVESAGSLIHAPAQHYAELPSGLGSRHAAAAAVSRACDCISIVVSASSGQVTLFRQGLMLPVLEKTVAGNY